MVPIPASKKSIKIICYGHVQTIVQHGNAILHVEFPRMHCFQDSRHVTHKNFTCQNFSANCALLILSVIFFNNLTLLVSEGSNGYASVGQRRHHLAMWDLKCKTAKLGTVGPVCLIHTASTNPCALHVQM